LNKFKSGIANVFLPVLVSLLIKTLRIKYTNLPPENERAVYIFWHSRMLVGWWLFRDKKYSALVSQSKDGEILTDLLNYWGYKVLRGSSSKGGKEALEELISASEKSSVVLTPDGPRGPANVIKNGALIISNKSGIPIIPVKINYKKKKVLSKSWDKFEIPYPFSECEVHFGERIFYEKYLENEQLENFKNSLSQKM
jgi:lysophospholipid acyltransferase (LPLAT)-like uncharacterized protein